jgi:hypothetical protein
MLCNPYVSSNSESCLHLPSAGIITCTTMPSYNFIFNIHCWTFHMDLTVSNTATYTLGGLHNTGIFPSKVSSSFRVFRNIKYYSTIIGSHFKSQIINTITNMKNVELKRLQKGQYENWNKTECCLPWLPLGMCALGDSHFSLVSACSHMTTVMSRI